MNEKADFLNAEENVLGDYSPGTRNKAKREFAHDWLEVEYMMDEGQLDPMSAYAKLYTMQKQLNDVVSRVKEMAFEARKKYDAKEQIIAEGFELKLVSTRRFSFDHDDAQNSLKAEIKERESLMKKAASMSEKNKQLIVHGEIIEPALVGETEYLKMEKAK